MNEFFRLIFEIIFYLFLETIARGKLLSMIAYMLISIAIIIVSVLIVILSAKITIYLLS